MRWYSLFLVCLVAAGCSPTQAEAIKKLSSSFQSQSDDFAFFSANFTASDELADNASRTHYEVVDGSIVDLGFSDDALDKFVASIKPERISVWDHDEGVAIDFVTGGKFNIPGGVWWGFRYESEQYTDFNDEILYRQLDGKAVSAKFRSCEDAVRSLNTQYIEYVTCRLDNNWSAFYVGD